MKSGIKEKKKLLRRNKNDRISSFFFSVNAQKQHNNFSNFLKFDFLTCMIQIGTILRFIQKEMRYSILNAHNELVLIDWKYFFCD